MGCSPWGRKESDMTLKQLSTNTGGIHRGPGRGQEVASGWRHQGCQPEESTSELGLKALVLQSWGWEGHA